MTSNKYHLVKRGHDWVAFVDYEWIPASGHQLQTYDFGPDVVVSEPNLRYNRLYMTKDGRDDESILAYAFQIDNGMCDSLPPFHLFYF